MPAVTEIIRSAHAHAPPHAPLVMLTATLSVALVLTVAAVESLDRPSRKGPGDGRFPQIGPLEYCRSSPGSSKAPFAIVAEPRDQRLV